MVRYVDVSKRLETLTCCGGAVIFIFHHFYVIGSTICAACARTRIRRMNDSCQRVIEAFRMVSLSILALTLTVSRILDAADILVRFPSRL